jgi:phosphoribosyl 1,2-cyclic phosphate phosphodiesterase
MATMRFHILGSSAGKTVPRPFCTCRVCTKARADGGRDVRTRCSVHLYLDDEPQGRPRYAIDFGPDLSSNLIRFKCSLDQLEHVIFTHAHMDHLETHLLNIRPSILSDRLALPMLSIYGSGSVQEKIEATCDLKALNAQFHRVDPFTTFTAGELRFSTLLANHGPGTALNHIVEYGGKSVLLAWDTGWWSDATWEAVAANTFDTVISECTVFGPSEVETDSRHLNFATLLEMRSRLIELGCVTEATPWSTLHIGDNGGLTYDEAVSFALPHGITVGYDGQWVVIP